MSVKVFNTRIQLKHDTAANWASDQTSLGQNLVLLPGEFAWDSTNNNFKVGDGTKTWSQLPYAIGVSKLNGYTTSITPGDVADGDTLLTALAKIELKADQGGVTSFGGQTGAITLGNYLTMGSEGTAKQVNVNHVDTAGTSTTDTDLATIKTVDTKIGALNVDSFKQASITASSGSSTLTINGISETAGKIVTDSTTNKVDILIDGEYDASTNKIATKSTVTTAVENAINALDVPASGDGAITGFGAGKTLATLTETDGKIAASFQPISITSSQVSDIQHTYSSSDEKAISGKGVAAAIGTLDGSHNVATAEAYTPGTDESARYKLDIFDATETDGVVSTNNSASETLYFSQAYSASNPIITKADIGSLSGAMHFKNTVNSNSDLPSSGQVAGDVYIVATAGTYASQACEVGDMIVWNGSAWTIVTGENQVTPVDGGANLVAGEAATTIGTVDGVELTAKTTVNAGSATIATLGTGANAGIVTLKTGVTQGTGTGTITNASGTDITLAKVAKTGNAEDITVDSASYGGDSNVTNAQAALNNLATAVGTINTTISELDAIADADTASGIGYATVTTSTPSDDFKVLKSVTEENGKLTSATAYNLKKVAATGAAADVSLADTVNNYESTTVEGAFAEILTFDLILNCGSATSSVHTQTTQG